ncbi:unnamed protein product, partial [Ectocarpus sp. 12 AP-2014]
CELAHFYAPVPFVGLPCCCLCRIEWWIYWKCPPLPPPPLLHCARCSFHTRRFVVFPPLHVELGCGRSRCVQGGICSGLTTSVAPALYTYGLQCSRSRCKCPLLSCWPFLRSSPIC